MNFKQGQMQDGPVNYLSGSSTYAFEMGWLDN